MFKSQHYMKFYRRFYCDVFYSIAFGIPLGCIHTGSTYWIYSTHSVAMQYWLDLKCNSSGSEIGQTILEPLNKWIIFSVKNVIEWFFFSKHNLRNFANILPLVRNCVWYFPFAKLPSFGIRHRISTWLYVKFPAQISVKVYICLICDTVRQRVSEGKWNFLFG